MVGHDRRSPKADLQLRHARFQSCNPSSLRCLDPSFTSTRIMSGSILRVCMRHLVLNRRTDCDLRGTTELAASGRLGLSSRRAMMVITVNGSTEPCVSKFSHKNFASAPAASQRILGVGAGLRPSKPSGRWRISRRALDQATSVMVR
jgi:hypothetical protein